MITKKRGRPLVTGLVGVSMMSCKGKKQEEEDVEWGGGEEVATNRRCQVNSTVQCASVKSF